MQTSMVKNSNFFTGFPWIHGPFCQREEKNLHSLQDCARCEATNPSSSSMHRSVSEKTENIMFKANDLINEISTLTPNRTANGQLQMMNI